MLEQRVAAERGALREAIAGWRTWGIAGSPDGAEAVLLPIAGTSRPWPPRLPVRAACTRRRFFHRVPDPECRCGIYATRSTELLRRTRDPCVLGRVAVWGRVVEHEHGYRAELGYPQRLALICPLCAWRRGVVGSRRPEVVIRHRGGRMIPLCEPHVDLCRRHGYPIRRLLDARVVERALLDAYAVEVLPSTRASVTT